MPRAVLRVPDSRSRNGLALLEILLLLCVLSLLAILGVPELLRWRESARQQVCRQRLHVLSLGLRSYHDVYATLPPAAVWNPDAVRSSALHYSPRIDLITHENWAWLLLPLVNEQKTAALRSIDRAIGDDANSTARRTHLAAMNCPSDPFNQSTRPYQFSRIPGRPAISFARGNYALNGGTQNFDLNPASTTNPLGDLPHLIMQDQPQRYALWGNGIAGINRSFTLAEMTNGLGTLIALEEVRAGVHPLDPRGVWSLGQIGGSITWGHGVNGDDCGPNNPWSRADDILGCGALHEALGEAALARECMPCVSYVDRNQQATARSTHPGGVHVAFLDGSVRFLADQIDSGLWHVLHSRETPASALEQQFDSSLSGPIDEHRRAGDGLPPSRVPTVPATTAVAPLPGEPPLLLNSLDMQFALVPAGEFTMGVPDAGNGYNLPPECPAHQVRITRPFRLGTCEVTRGQFFQVLGPQALPPLPDGAQTVDPRSLPETDLPVTDISWDLAVDFCQRLAQLPAERTARRCYRLPTEAEWEYACRAGQSTPYAWHPRRAAGDESGETAGIEPPLPLMPVGSYPPNPLGLFDLRGNAWEWTADWFARDYYARSPASDPPGPAGGFLKVVRGSDWRFTGEQCRLDSAALPPWKSNPFVGFRVVCELAAQNRDN